MRINNRLFPYPVLRKEYGDYLSTAYSIDITSDLKNKIKFVFNCTNESVNKLIKENKASFAIHIECKHTYYRELLTAKNTFEYTINDSKVENIIEVCALILATQKIVDFISDDLDDLYKGISITFERGDIIALGEQIKIPIIKDKDFLKKNRPPFYIIPYSEGMEQEYISLNFKEDDQIGISLKEEDYAKLNLIQQNSPQYINTIHSAIYFPALLMTIQEMRDNSDITLEDKKWYIAIEDKAKELGIGSIKTNTKTTLEVAQILFKYPISRWLKEIGKSGGEDNNG